MLYVCLDARWCFAPKAQLRQKTQPLKSPSDAESKQADKSDDLNVFKKADYSDATAELWMWTSPLCW